MQSAKQFIGYFERMKKAEDTLRTNEKTLSKAVIENKEILAEQGVLQAEFVADHLEWGCEQGITVFEIEAYPLSTKYAVRFQ